MKVRFTVEFDTLLDAAEFEEALQTNGVEDYIIEAVGSNTTKPQTKKPKRRKPRRGRVVPINALHVGAARYMRHTENLTLPTIVNQLGIGKSTISAICRGSYPFKHQSIRTAGMAVARRLEKGEIALDDVIREAKATVERQTGAKSG